MYEKFFNVKYVVSKQNNRLYATLLGNIFVGVRLYFKRHKTLIIMASDGSKYLLVFIKGVTLYSRIYQKFSRNVLFWSSATFGSRFVFTQYVVPTVHTTFLTQNWFKNNFSWFFDNSISYPSSHDTNSFDFSIWYILGSDVSHISFPSVSDRWRWSKI